jgi:hypothetical protein
MPSWAYRGLPQLKAETTATINNGLIELPLVCWVRRRDVRPRRQPLGLLLVVCRIMQHTEPIPAIASGSQDDMRCA